MDRQVEIRLDIPGAGQGQRPVWPVTARLLLIFCAATSVALLLVAESRLPAEQRQYTLAASGVYP